MLLVVLHSHPLQDRKCQHLIRRLCIANQLLYVIIESFASVCIAYSTTKKVLYEVIILSCRGLCSQMQITGAANILLTRRVSRDVLAARYLLKLMERGVHVADIA